MGRELMNSKLMGGNVTNYQSTHPQLLSRSLSFGFQFQEIRCGFYISRQSTNTFLFRVNVCMFTLQCTSCCVVFSAVCPQGRFWYEFQGHSPQGTYQPIEVDERCIVLLISHSHSLCRRPLSFNLVLSRACMQTNWYLYLTWKSLSCLQQLVQMLNPVPKSGLKHV